MADTGNMIQLIEAGLRGSSLRTKVIANNLANTDTPGYRRKDVRFEELLADALNSSKAASGPGQVQGEVFEPMTTPVDSMGNDVDFQIEFGQMIKNGVMQKTYLRLLNKTYKQMELAIGVR